MQLVKLCMYCVVSIVCERYYNSNARQSSLSAAETLKDVKTKVHPEDTNSVVSATKFAFKPHCP